MGTLKLQVVSPPTPLASTTTLANGSAVEAGQFDNTSSLAPMVDVGLAPVFASAPTPASGIVVSLYLVPYVNGTNPGTVDAVGLVFPAGSFVGNFVVTTVATSPYLSVQAAALSALKYDAYLVNKAGVAISSFTLTFNPSDWQY